jgi:imidazoleglycerol-phosphate dehydratase
MNRQARLERKTRETGILCSLNLDGEGHFDIQTPVGFFSHMLETFSRHFLIDLELSLQGGFHIDQHHGIEDAGMVREFFHCSKIGE